MPALDLSREQRLGDQDALEIERVQDLVPAVSGLALEKPEAFTDAADERKRAYQALNRAPGNGDRVRRSLLEPDVTLQHDVAVPDVSSHGRDRAAPAVHGISTLKGLPLIRRAS